MTRRLLLLGAVLAAALAATHPAAAGGWATSSLDEVPGSLPAGEEVLVGFTVLQHGMTPVNPEGQVGIRMVSASTGATETFPATAQGAPGHHVATVRVPEPGTWRWEVLQGWFQPHDLGTIEVTAAGPVDPAGTTVAGTEDTGTRWWRVLAVGAAAVLAAWVVAELVTGRRRSTREAATA